MAVIGYDQRIYCCIECLRRMFGALANPYRRAFKEECVGDCDGCSTPLD